MSEAPLPGTDPAPRTETSDAARQPRTRGWLWMLLVLVAGGASWYHYDRYQERVAQEEAEKKAAEAKGPGKGRGAPIPVVAVPARKGRINVYLDGLGTVTPLRTVTVRSRVEGQLMRVHFREGEMVEQGQLLAQIDPRPYQVQLAQAEGQLARDQALLANARIDVDRYRTLLAQDSIAKQQVDAQEALVRQYEGIVKSDQSQVDNARLQLSYARITAPLGGRVGLRQVDPGNIVRAGDATGIVVIAQLAPVGVLFTVPQDNLPALMKRMQEEDRLLVEAWDREQKNLLARGRLLAVDNLVDVATGTVKLKASFRNEENELFPNQFVNVRLRLDTLDDQTVIQQGAVQRGGRGLFVYVVKEDMTVTARPVTLGPADGPRVAVLKGVEPGERVVVDGIDRLREGARVILSKRPDFKPSIDGTSGARKGKGKGKPPAEGAPAAPAAEAAGAPAPEKGASDASEAPRKGSRRSGEGDGAKGGAPGDPEKQARRRKPPADGDAAGDGTGSGASDGSTGGDPEKKARRKPKPVADAEGATDGTGGRPSSEGGATGGDPEKKARRKPKPPAEAADGAPAGAAPAPAPQ